MNGVGGKDAASRRALCNLCASMRLTAGRAGREFDASTRA